MPVWTSTQYPVGAAAQLNDDWRTSCKYHGQQADDECTTVWYVQQYGKSDGHCRYRCSVGGLDTDAVYSHDHGALGAGCPYRAYRKYASAE